MNSLVHHSFPGLLMFLALGCVLPGCGGNENRANISGKVILDGEPLPEGLIQFVPAPGVQGPPVQMQIVKGAYSSPTAFRPTIGKNSVQITAMKKTGKTVKNIMGEASDEVRQYLPPRYNEFTELSVEVQRGTNQFDFELKSE